MSDDREQNRQERDPRNERRRDTTRINLQQKNRISSSEREIARSLSQELREGNQTRSSNRELRKAEHERLIRDAYRRKAEYNRMLGVTIDPIERDRHLLMLKKCNEEIGRLENELKTL